MAYFPPYQSIANAPASPALTPNWGAVTNSPMFQGYEGGAPMPSYLQPTPSAIPTAPVYGPANYGALSNPAAVDVGESLASQAAPAAYDFGSAAPKLGLRKIIGGALRTPEFGVAGGATLLGSLLRDNTREGTAPHIAGTALATGGATATLPALASGVGLLGGSTLGLPITIGALAGGAGGSLINHALGSGGGTDFGPFHWHNGGGPHSTSPMLDDAPDIVHLIGDVAPALLKQGDISSDDFKTIVKTAQLNHSMGIDPKQTAADIGSMIQQAAQLQMQRAAEAKTNQTSAHDQLLQQAAIAKLMQPEINQINEGSRGLAESIAASRSNLAPQFQPFADMLSRNAVAGGHRQAAALTASTLALPQVQALIASINQQNALQQAANYQAAKASSGSGSGSSLSDLLNPQQATQVAGAGGANGL